MTDDGDCYDSVTRTITSSNSTHFTILPNYSARNVCANKWWREHGGRAEPLVLLFQRFVVNGLNSGWSVWSFGWVWNTLIDVSSTWTEVVFSVSSQVTCCKLKQKKKKNHTWGESCQESITFSSRRLFATPTTLWDKRENIDKGRYDGRFAALWSKVSKQQSTLFIYGKNSCSFEVSKDHEFLPEARRILSLVCTSDASTSTSSNIRALISSWKPGWRKHKQRRMRKHKDQNISISLCLRFCLRSLALCENKTQHKHKEICYVWPMKALVPDLHV